MEHLTAAVRQSIVERNWFAALGMALTLPDICGRLETGDRKSKRRYVAWCRQYLEPKYTGRMGPSPEVAVRLHGEDCYALRCAVLHEGSDNLDEQDARKALDGFRFVTPNNVLSPHRNMEGGRLQLQVDLFCEDICAGVDEWLATVPPRDPVVAERVARLMKIENPDDTGFFGLG